MIPAYRAGRWIAGAVNSVLAQQLPAGWTLEVLVGVDACPETFEAARTIEDPRVRLFEMASNVGPYVVLNTLCDHVAGDYMTFHGADDEMVGGRLTAMLALLTEWPAGEAIAGTWFVDTNEALQPLRWHRSPADGAIMIHRRLIERIGGFRAWRCAADTDFVIRALALGVEPVTVDQFLLLRRCHAQQLTAAGTTGHFSALRAEYRAEIQTQIDRLRAGHPPDVVQRCTAPVARMIQRAASCAE